MNYTDRACKSRISWFLWFWSFRWICCREKSKISSGSYLKINTSDDKKTLQQAWVLDTYELKKWSIFFIATLLYLQRKIGSFSFQLIEIPPPCLETGPLPFSLVSIDFGSSLGKQFARPSRSPGGCQPAGFQFSVILQTSAVRLLSFISVRGTTATQVLFKHLHCLFVPNKLF